MKALLIAGGFGTRLRPLTLTRPKHLLPIANRPHIEHVLRHLETHGITHVVLLTSYLADAFGGVIEAATQRGMSVEVAHEEEPLGTAGALKNAEHLVGSETFFAFNGDVLTDCDLTALLRFHRDRAAAGTILLTPVEDPSAYGVVPTDDTGRVSGFIEKPPPGKAPTNQINAGVYILEPSVLVGIPLATPVSLEREVFPSLADGGELYAMASDSSYWMDIGTPQKYLQANLDALSGKFVTDVVDQPGPNGAAIHVDARIDDAARVSSACIGPGCVIERDASVSESVLLPSVHVSAGARITRSVVGEGCRVTPGAVLTDEAIGDRQEI